MQEKNAKWSVSLSHVKQKLHFPSVKANNRVVVQTHFGRREQNVENLISQTGSLQDVVNLCICLCHHKDHVLSRPASALHNPWGWSQEIYSQHILYVSFFYKIPIVFLF